MNKLLRDLKMDIAFIVIGILMVIRGLILLCMFPFVVVKEIVNGLKKK